jgi:RNA polymerase-interacting CarD/CdnL/TRCF family regulator
MAVNHGYEEGDWLVHVSHGIGQVITLEEKSIGNRQDLYYRIEGIDCTFWVPASKIENERIRPAVSKRKMQEAIRVLKRPPRDLERDYKKRQTQIKEIMSEHSLAQNARLVRDLYNAQANRKLGVTESRILEHLEKHLIMEWSVVFRIDLDEATRRLKDSLSADRMVRR